MDFNQFSDFWKGSPATVVPDDEQFVWGALWQLNVSDLDHLDKQEGVQDKYYLPFEANIVTPDSKSVLCRSYMLCNQPIKQTPLPLDRRPSKAYLKTILLGAQESNLPSDYLKSLNAIPDNGNDGPTMPWINH